MSGEEDTELRDLVLQVLENNCVLAKIETISTLHNKPLKQILNTTEGVVAASLVREFLDFFNLDCTLAIFDPEAFSNSEFCPSTRHELLQQLGLPEGPARLPVLLMLLQKPSVATTENFPEVPILEVQGNVNGRSHTSSSSNQVLAKDENECSPQKSASPEQNCSPEDPSHPPNNDLPTDSVPSTSKVLEENTQSLPPPVNPPPISKESENKLERIQEVIDLECASAGGGPRTAYGLDSTKQEEDASHMLSHTENSTVPSSPKSDKYVYDSGCISGALTSEQAISSSCNLPLSSNIQSPGSSKENDTDSGFLEGNSSFMKLDSGECASLSKLTLKSGLDDLNATPRTCATMVLDSSGSPSIASSSKPPKVHVSTPAPTIPQQSQIGAYFDYKFFLQDQDGDTKLHFAVLQGFVEVVHGLLRMAPEPSYLNVSNDLHQTAMHLAVLTSQAPIVRALLVAGASPGSRDRHGNTPLHLASMQGATDCVRALLQPVTMSEIVAAGLCYDPAGMFINHVTSIIDVPNYDGQMCVHLAAAEGHVGVLRQLVESGADINVQDGKLGRTPIHMAAERGQRRIASYLLQECSEVDLSLATFAGYTAYQLAQYSDPTLAHELAKHGAAIRARRNSLSSGESD